MATGRFARGNVEIWNNDYFGNNSLKIPGAADNRIDFGDARGAGRNWQAAQLFIVGQFAK